MATAGPSSNAQPAGMGAAMLPMLFLLLMMMSLMMFPGIRNSLSDGAGIAIEPLLFGTLGLDEYFVPTVFILGSSIMIVNTIIRSFFMDPLKQAHHSHRSKQISQQMREARMSRDTAHIEKMQKLQMEMMPEQMAMQGAMMKPMMFTMIFIIGIFSWMADTVLEFRVDYVSLPWQPMWGFENKVMWIFPAWIATYITMSAPLGRIIDRAKRSTHRDVSSHPCWKNPHDYPIHIPHWLPRNTNIINSELSYRISHPTENRNNKNHCEHHWSHHR